MASRGSSLLQLPTATFFRNPLTRSSPRLWRCASTATSSRLSPTFPPFRLDRIYAQPQRASLNPIHKRNVTGNSSHNLLAHMEQTANNNPGSATAQNAFYAALLRANMPAVVVERYQTGRYASNAACQSTYTKALQTLGNSDSMMTTGYGNNQSSGPGNSTLQAIAQAVAAKSNGGSTAFATRMGSGADQGSKKAPIYVVTEESWSQTVFKWAKMLLYFGLMCYVVLVAIHLVVDATGILRRATGAQTIEPSTQKARFADVKGCDEAKEELQELVEFLRDPSKFNALGGKLPKGVMLTGPPGTGKTLLARAVAGEADVPFFYMAGSEFDEVYVGVGAKRIRELFNVARAKGPAIIFIDELDAIGGKRSEKEASYHKQTLNQLLTELDGFEQDSGIIIIGATNFPQSLDKALTRPGRFDRNIVVDLPDVRGRLAILNHYIEKVKLVSSIDMSAIARSTMGFSGADLENLVNMAAVRAAKLKQSAVTHLDLDWSLDKVMMGAEKKSKVSTKESILATAYHEAGHTLVGLYCEGARDVYKVTIVPRGFALGVTYFLPDMDQDSLTVQQAKAVMAVSMGGRIAEELIYGPEKVTSGASSDIESITSIAHNMVTSWGFSEKMGEVNYAHDRVSASTLREIDTEVKSLSADARATAMRILSERKEELHLVAHALVKHETLTVDEVRAIIRGEEIEDKLTGIINYASDGNPPGASQGSLGGSIQPSPDGPRIPLPGRARDARTSADATSGDKTDV